MAVTPNYNWPIPVATDYVKDGWDAIADLGNAIDTTVAGLGTAGLSLVTASTFTSQSSVSINNCFTSTYTNYRIVFDISNVSLWAATLFRLRASGTDTTSGYSWAHNVAKSNATSTVYGSASGSYFVVVGANTNYPTFGVMDICAPQLARYTTMNHQYMGGDNVNWLAVMGGGQLVNTTQYDGFTIYPDSGSSNLTGTVRVYGYKNS